MREMLLIIVVTLCTLTSQLLVKAGAGRLPVLEPARNLSQWLWAVATSPNIIGAVAIQGFGFVLWVLVVSRVKLGVAFALSGAIFYFLIAVASWLLYGERLTGYQWAGLTLISIGVTLMVWR